MSFPSFLIKIWVVDDFISPRMAASAPLPSDTNMNKTEITISANPLLNISFLASNRVNSL